MMKTQKKRILVVDDLATDSKLLKRYLQECHDYVIQEENDPRDALVAAEKFQPDLILLDLLMPEMDGVEVAAAIRASPKLNAVPIVFLTAALTREQVEGAAGKIGSYPVLAKPIHLGEVAACLERHLGRRSIERSTSKK